MAKKKSATPDSTKAATALVVLVIVVLVAAYAVLSGGPVAVGSAGVSENITANGFPFILNGTEYMAYFGGRIGNGGASIQIVKMPSFINPTISVLLYNSTVHLNLTGRYADIEFNPVKVYNSSALVKIKAVPESLKVQPDSEYIKISGPYGFGTNSNSTTTVKAVSSTTTASTTTSTVSSAPTTSVSANDTLAKINGLLATDSDYLLIENYTTLYSNTYECTPGMYNSTYFKIYGSYPSGQFTYQNVSNIVPYGIVSKQENLGYGIYEENYQTKSGIGTLEFASIYINTTADSLINSTIFGANYSVLYSAELRAHSIGNACGIYIAGV
ncbi:MAG: hypothetical protein LVQ97_03425 [Candidatus Micrarchaeales archaeon]|jgi:hypothetical protein|uniref:Uncharacterized protein n=1 Tax=Candidatus Micrarchaeum acidiphilum ARMAN-2 TaxID=425595 RepID=C7DGN7_MICA2|nr:MAG: hypothetical protein UNLARM2_0238 [Candidatus Micrarchaeum acidiphilum ARMAN-2]MCW6161209.1 hypothetical protein [Candidatus Micrarchaeales archaeon]